MLTRSEAQAVVHAVLESLSRLDPIGRKDLFIFAMEMSRILDFPGDDDPASDIEAWAEAWLDARWARAAPVARFPVRLTTIAPLEWRAPSDESD